MDWKKLITPAVIVAVVMALIGVIYNTMASDVHELEQKKADNQTLQMYIIQQEKRTEAQQTANDLKQKELDIRQKELDLKQRTIELKQREIETRVKLHHPDGE